MEQTGIVIETDKDRAFVKVIRSAACGEACGSCTICTNAEIKKWVSNDIGAAQGDRVIIYLQSGRMLAMAFAAYIAPVLAAALCCIIITVFIKTKIIADFLSFGVLAASVWTAAKAKFFKGGAYQSRVIGYADIKEENKS